MGAREFLRSLKPGDDAALAEEIRMKAEMKAEVDRPGRAQRHKAGLPRLGDDRPRGDIRKGG